MRHATVKVENTSLCGKVRTAVVEAKTFHSGKLGKWENLSFPSQLVDLPTVVECHKTLDNKTLYKTGNISQMLICTHELPDTASVTNLEELPSSQQKEYLKKFTYNHGCGWSQGAGSEHVVEARLL